MPLATTDASGFFCWSSRVDKKAKNRIKILRERIEKLQKQLAGAKEQEDEPGEVDRIKDEIEKTLAEIETLKAS